MKKNFRLFLRQQHWKQSYSDPRWHNNLETLEFTKANGVIMQRLPHCTHGRQPLKVSYFEPLETYYNRAMSISLKVQCGRTVGLHQVADIFGSPYGSAATVGNITSRLKKSEIYLVFSSHLFLSRKVTDNVIQLKTHDEKCEKNNRDFLDRLYRTQHSIR